MMASTPTTVENFSNNSFATVTSGDTVLNNSSTSGSVLISSQSSPLSAFLHQTLMCTIFGCTIVDLCTLLVAGFGTHFVYRTKILHPNLRLVLSVQCFVVGLWALIDIATNMFKIWANSPEAIGPAWLAALYSFTLQFVNFIGHVLLIERAMATIWVSRYENSTGPWFSIVWIALLTAICGSNSLFYYLTMVSTGMPLINAFTLIINYVLLVLSFLEILVIAKLGLYNAAKFTQSTFYQKNVRLNSLSERYQLSENVRTMKQLFPTFIAHFLGVLLTNIGLNLGFVSPIVTFPILMFVFLFISFVNLAMVIAIIEFHPALRLKWRRLFRRLSFHHICCAENPQSNASKTVGDGAKEPALVVAISMNSRAHSIGGGGPNGCSFAANTNKPSSGMNNHPSIGRETIICANIVQLQQRRWRTGSPTLVFPYTHSSQMTAAAADNDEKERLTQQHFKMLKQAWSYSTNQNLTE